MNTSRQRWNADRRYSRSPTGRKYDNYRDVPHRYGQRSDSWQSKRGWESSERSWRSPGVPSHYRVRGYRGRYPRGGRNNPRQRQYSRSPKHRQYPSSPRHRQYPSSPGHRRYPSSPGHRQYPSSPGHRHYSDNKKGHSNPAENVCLKHKPDQKSAQGGEQFWSNTNQDDKGGAGKEEEDKPQGKINVFMLEDPMYNYMQEKYRREKEDRSDGTFSVNNLPSSSYVLEISNSDYVFEPARVDINSKGKIRARRVNNVQPSAVSQVTYPLNFKARGKANYYQQREQWRITDLLMNPMVLMMVVPFLMIMILPKLINTADPETQREMQSQMNLLNPKQNMPEMSELITNFFGGGSTKKPTKTKPSKHRQ